MELFGSEWEMIIRLVVAVALGLMVGAERSRVGKRAGMRTYALVSLGAALFVIIAGMVSFQYASSFVFDPNRVLSQIVVGVGFLGGGMIFVSKKDVVNGLTTAAGIWVTAAVGAACGYGLYSIATFVTFLVLMIFEVLWYVEERFIKKADPVTKEPLPLTGSHDAHYEDEN